MKLHLGCGVKRLDGFLNVDLKNSDRDCDIRSLRSVFDDESAEEIMAIHVCEHFYIHDIADILEQWLHVLKPGGKLILELPCWDKVIEHIKQGSPDNMTRWPLFGDPRTHTDGEPALHKWIYSRAEFKKLLGYVGFNNIKEETPHYHVASRDMRWTAER